MLVSLVAGVMAALCYGVASVMQAVAVRAASRRAPGGEPSGTALGSVDPGLVVRMLRQWRFVASLGLDLIGFLAQASNLAAALAAVAGLLLLTAASARWVRE